MKKLLMGAEVAVMAASDAGAEMMYGYPITPTSEVFSGWINSGKKYLQTEDEIAAGFCICGAVLAGQKAFTATSGPGHILMQDALSMAEGMRLPFVAIIGMRGGPSSGTVIYSQQEVTLACFGGNGEGIRLVYSPSNLQELYDLTVRAFNDAWKYKIPTVVLTDGYLLKSKGVFAQSEKKKDIQAGKSFVNAGENTHLPSIYNLEEELYEKIMKDKVDYDKMSSEVIDDESYETEDAETIIVAHGIVGAVAKSAVIKLRKEGKKVGLFRPISLRPFPAKSLDKIARSANRMLVVESSLGQLERIVRSEMDSEISIKIDSMHRPGLGIETDDIINEIK